MTQSAPLNSTIFLSAYLYNLCFFQPPIPESAPASLKENLGSEIDTQLAELEKRPSSQL
jgi:hypothetical protein